MSEDENIGTLALKLKICQEIREIEARNPGLANDQKADLLDLYVDGLGARITELRGGV